MELVSARRKDRRSGHAVLEVALLSPWIFFLFVGTFDVGMYVYALICAQNAARVAAVYTSSNSTLAADSSGACQYVLNEMNAMHNVRSLSTCGSLPVIVNATSVTGADGASASSVSVTYQTDQFIPMPGLMGRFTFTRIAQMRIR